jgi:alkanesulfonate monooxygenase SsuD/methylene tetrahydromethanopterin reductase-like flavin-dependent oxidoreductase (luciferase family)
LIMPALTARIADTDEEAQRLEEEIHRAKDFSKTLAQFGRSFGWHDFSQYDLDAPFPVHVASLGEKSFRTASEHIVKVATEQNLTLRETVLHFERQHRSPFVGSAQTVADEIERWFVGRAADGFIVTVAVPSEFARFADEVLPLLRERGLFRSEYESTTLRGNLGLPVPANVHTVARGATDSAPIAVPS